MKRSVAAVGDVADPHAWSGIPYHFWKAGSAAGFVAEPWRVDLRKITWQRKVWNLGRLLSGRPGGFQYSPWFLRLLEEQIPPELWATEIITFHQHFPHVTRVARRGGILNHYLDAPFAALASGRGLDLQLPRSVVDRARALENENLQASQRVILMARWAAEVTLQECGVDPARVHVVLPGANLELPVDWTFAEPAPGAGKERDFVLGFVGKDWRRKGLSVLLSVQQHLFRRGWRVKVLVAGNAPPELARLPGLEFVGYLDKQQHPREFLGFLSRCDLGCLFSDREALGISTLEFLRAGIPVAGFAHEGPADTLPPDAGFRFARGTSAEEIGETLDLYLRDEDRQRKLRRSAQAWSPLVTWERCVRELEQLWTNKSIDRPVQPWRGLASMDHSLSSR